jgi:hypothetical protein
MAKVGIELRDIKVGGGFEEECVLPEAQRHVCEHAGPHAER